MKMKSNFSKQKAIQESVDSQNQVVKEIGGDKMTDRKLEIVVSGTIELPETILHFDLDTIMDVLRNYFSELKCQPVIYISSESNEFKLNFFIFPVGVNFSDLEQFDHALHYVIAQVHGNCVIEFSVKSE